MRLRTLVALAATAAAVAATPASAFIAPICTARLVDADAMASTYCATEDAPPIGSRVTRTMTVEVLAGAVDAWLQCGASTSARQVVSGPEPVRISIVEAGRNCTANMVAVVGNTTATATSTFLYTPVR